jgi:dCTP deaminase
MSVIPLTTDGPNRTVVQKQDDFDLEGDAVLITSIDVSQLNEERSSNVSYDLRIGKKCRDHRKDDPNEIPDGGIVKLRPGAALIIQTKEYVHFPRSLFGIIA